MRITGLALLLAITTACATVGAPGPKETRKPTDPPSGEWEVLKWEKNGRVQVEFRDRPSDMTMRFAPTKWITLDGKFPVEERAGYYKNGEAFEIDLSPGNPKSVMRGIWKIDGDTLLLCLAARGADRPTEFTAPKDSKRSLWTLKRKKE
jgi:uncharacterized protein (TIGR03067 family)